MIVRIQKKRRQDPWNFRKSLADEKTFNIGIKEKKKQEVQKMKIGCDRHYKRLRDVETEETVFGEFGK